MSLPVGSRLCVEKCKATVRYVGRIEGQQGTWVGLDWDDAGRGKHDGSTGGHRYFTCSGSASSGSFVREPRLLQVAELGTCVPTAIEIMCVLLACSYLHAEAIHIIGCHVYHPVYSILMCN